MNRDDELDFEIAELEKKLTGNQKAGKKLLRDELEEENLLELFTCVDHILQGKFRGQKGVNEENASPDDEEDDADEEGEEEIEEGEEEFGEEEFEEDDDEGEEEEEKKNPKKVEERVKLGHQNQTEASSLQKRAPIVKDGKPEFKPNIKVNELADLLFIRCKDNKDLLTQVNRLCSFIHQQKLSGTQLAQAVVISHSLKQPSNPAFLVSLKKAEKKNNKEGDQKQEKRERQPSNDKQATYASQTDRLKAALYTLILFPRAFTVSFLRTLHSSEETLFLWSLSGLLVLGAVHGQVLVENLKQLSKNPAKNEIDNMDYEVHVIAKVVREKEPGSFKELSAVLKERYAGSAEVGTRLASHLEKLRNNMDIPGKTPFEVSNTVSKLLEKLVKKRRPDELKPVTTLSEMIGNSTEVTSGTQATITPQSSKKKNADVLASNPHLNKLADKLGLATQIEKKALQVVNQSTDYIDVVQGLIGLKTHGSENKEVACPLIKCCLGEKIYNPFYATVAQKLISVKPEFKYSFQLALWDEVKEAKELGEDKGSSIRNLGLFSASLVVGTCLDHRFFKFLDDSPLPLSSAKLSRVMLEHIVKKMPKDNIRLLCKKLAAVPDVGSNLKRIAKYLAKRKKEAGGDPQLEEKIIRWLEDDLTQGMGEEDYAV